MLSNRASFISLLAAALSLAACSAREATPMAPADQSPAYTEWQGGASGRNWGETRPVLCSALSPRVSSAIIGPLGGNLQIGPHVLRVPPGALPGNTQITGTTSGDSVNSIQFSPAGLHFAVPAVLSLSYANCSPPPLAKLKIVYTSDDFFVLLELIQSVDLKGNRNVVGAISHFSRYAVAY